MKIRRLTAGLRYSVVGALVLTTGASSRLLAHDHDGGPSTEKQKKQANALVKVVREATERYKDVKAAEDDGYSFDSAASAAATRGPWGFTT